MGKRRRARAISKLKFVKRKLIENRIRGKKDIENDAGDNWKSMKKQNCKKSIWRKWLTFFRQHWVNKKYKQNLYAMNSDENMNKYYRRKFRLKSQEEMKMLQIPFEPGQRFTKIIFKPKRNGMEATIAQYNSKSLSVPSIIEGQSHGTNNYGSISNQQEYPAPNKKGEPRYPHNLENLENLEKKESADQENLFTSALYLSENMNELAESTLSLESDQAEFTCEETGTYLGKADSDEPGKSLQALSEPSWNEKNKIFRHQKLQESLNKLWEQFIILENDDVLGPEEGPELSLSTCCSSIPLASSDRETSREVSPEILVNIKPFKEYTPRRYMNNPHECPKVDKMLMKLKKDIIAADSNDNGHIKKHRSQVCKPQRNQQKMFEYPDFRRNLNFLNGNEEKKLNITLGKLPDSKQALNKSHCFWGCNLEEIGYDGIINASSGKSKSNSNSAFCSIWGIYKSYMDVERLRKKKEGTLEEVLDDFDDKDHDIIFKKNMSQFKRQITSKMESGLENRPVAQFSEIFKVKLEKGEKYQKDLGQATVDKGQVGHVAACRKLENLSKLHFKEMTCKQRFLDNFNLLPSRSNFNNEARIIAMRIEYSPRANMGFAGEITLVTESHIRLVLERKSEKSLETRIPTPIQRSGSVSAVKLPENPFESVLTSKSDVEETEESELKRRHHCRAEGAVDEGRERRKEEEKAFGQDSVDLDTLNAANETAKCGSRPGTDEEKQQIGQRATLGIQLATAFLDSPLNALEIFNYSPVEYIRVEIEDAARSGSRYESGSGSGECQTSAMATLRLPRVLSHDSIAKRKLSLPKVLVSNSETLACRWAKEIGEYDRLLDVSLGAKPNAEDSGSPMKFDAESLASVEEDLRQDGKTERSCLTYDVNDVRVLHEWLFRKAVEKCGEQGIIKQELNEGSSVLKYARECNILKRTHEFNKTLVPRISNSVAGKKTNKCCHSQIQFLHRNEKRNFLQAVNGKCSNNSSCEKSTKQRDYGLTENRLRRFLRMAKEAEKPNLRQKCLKNRAVFEEGLQVRRTGSAYVSNSGGTFVESIYIHGAPKKKELIRSGVGSQERPTETDADSDSGHFMPNSNVAISSPPSENIKSDRISVARDLQEETRAAAGENPERLKMFFLKTNNKNFVNSDNVRECPTMKSCLGKGNKKMSLVILLSNNK